MFICRTKCSYTSEGWNRSIAGTLSPLLPVPLLSASVSPRPLDSRQFLALLLPSPLQFLVLLRPLFFPHLRREESPQLARSGSKNWVWSEGEAVGFGCGCLPSPSPLPLPCRGADSFLFLLCGDGRCCLGQRRLKRAEKLKSAKSSRFQAMIWCVLASGVKRRSWARGPGKQTEFWWSWTWTQPTALFWVSLRVKSRAEQAGVLGKERGRRL